ncbi:MAG: DUF6111 family protein [Pseudomonadota bacterium]
MIRIIIQNLLLLLLPTIIYVGYMLIRRRGTSTGNASQAFDDAPILWLLSIGAMLAIGAMALVASNDNAEVGKTYVPPVRNEDGTFTPGRFE